MGQQRFYHKANVDPETNEGKDQRSGLIILQKTKDLMKYLYTTWTKYPRSEKLGFVTDYKKCLFGFLEYIIAAQKKYFKKTTLQDADIQLEELRLFNDLSYDLRFIDEKRYKLINCENTAFGLPAGVQPELCNEEDWLFDRGMPIGNLTSQMFANIYLNELDQYCKHELGIHLFIRYVDDIIILWPDKEELKGILDNIKNFLEERLHLELNNKTSIRPAWLPVTFVGAQISPKFIRMRKSTRKRMFRRIKFIKKLFEACEIGFQKLNNTMQSYFGLIQHFTAGNLLRKIIDEFSFRIRNNS